MEKQMRQDYAAINGAWLLLKKYYKIDGDPDEYWDGLIKEGSDLYDFGRLGELLCDAVLTLLDERNKEDKTL